MFLLCQTVPEFWLLHTGVCQPLCIQLCALSLSLDTIEAFDVSAHACVYVFNDNSVLLGFACFQSDSPCFWMFGVILPMACA